MNLCDHHTWLQVSNTKDLALHDTGRLSRLLSELVDPGNQKPSLLFLIGKRSKEVAIREMFPWNNVKKNRRDGIATLRVETSTIESTNPVFFAESDPFAPLNVEPETSFLCHQTFPHPIQWMNHPSDKLFDIIHSRLFYLFVDVLCIFADDFESFEHVADRLKTWAILKQGMDVHGHMACKVIIVKSGHGSSLSPTFDILERMDLQFSLLQRDLMDAFSSVVVLNLVDDQVSPLARHRRLKELIRRQTDDMLFLRQDRGCLYSAIHLNRFFTDAVLHLAQTADKPFEFLRSNNPESPVSVERHGHLRNFFDLSRQLSIEEDAVATTVASGILLDAYPVGAHSESFMTLGIFFV